MKSEYLRMVAIFSIIAIIFAIFFSSIQYLEPPNKSIEGDHLTVLETTATTYTIEIRNIPIEKSTLNCDSMNTEISVVKFNFIKTYDIGETVPDNALIDILNRTDVVIIENVASETDYRCVLFNSTGILDEAQFRINGDGALHQVTSLTLSNDWDHLTASWNTTEEVVWSRVELRLEGQDSYHNTRMGDNGSAYIGGIAEGNWFLSIAATDLQGDLNELEWFTFYYDGKSCDFENTTCPTIIDLIPSDGPE